MERAITRLRLAGSAALVVACLGTPPGAAATPSPNLLRQALDPNPALSTYTATVTLSAVLHAVVAVRKTLHGTAYYRKPERTIVFADAPRALKRFSALAATTPAYEQILRDYRTAPLGDDGATSSYALTPVKRDGRVQTLTVRVADDSHLIRQATWLYNGGETLSLTPAYTASAGFQLLSSVTISARFPGYDVDGTLQFSDYRLNVPVPDFATVR